MQKKFMLGILAFVGLSSLVVLGSSTNLVEGFLESVKDIPVASVFLQKNESEQDNPINQAKTQNIESSGNGEIEGAGIPEYVLYDRMFSLSLKFKKLAEEQVSRGEPATAFHGYFEREANLNDWQAVALQETAVAYVEAVGVVDTQAELIINQLRLQNPVAISKGEFIKPSPELLQLQEQRNKLALQYRDQLSNLLGTEKFNELDKFVKGRFASSFQAITLSAISNSKDQGGQ